IGVTGVQTCALPISAPPMAGWPAVGGQGGWAQKPFLAPCPPMPPGPPRPPAPPLPPLPAFRWQFVTFMFCEETATRAMEAPPDAPAPPPAPPQPGAPPP